MKINESCVSLPAPLGDRSFHFINFSHPPTAILVPLLERHSGDHSSQTSEALYKALFSNIPLCDTGEISRQGRYGIILIG